MFCFRVPFLSCFPFVPTFPLIVISSLSLRPPAEFIPPVQEPYQYIIFRASEVKDLAVDEPPPRRSVHDDPAVLGVRAFPLTSCIPCICLHPRLPLSPQLYT